MIIIYIHTHGYFIKEQLFYEGVFNAKSSPTREISTQLT